MPREGRTARRIRLPTRATVPVPSRVHVADDRGQLAEKSPKLTIPPPHGCKAALSRGGYGPGGAHTLLMWRESR
jgi:hypothetical protein